MDIKEIMRKHERCLKNEQGVERANLFGAYNHAMDKTRYANNHSEKIYVY